MALSEGAEKIKNAYEELEYLSKDKKAKAEYDVYVDAQILEKMKMDYAEERGRTEGERKNKIEVAKEMLKDNMPIESIMKFTKLTKEEIENIK